MILLFIIICFETSREKVVNCIKILRSVGLKELWKQCGKKRNAYFLTISLPVMFSKVIYKRIKCHLYRVNVLIKMFYLNISYHKTLSCYCFTLLPFHTNNKPAADDFKLIWKRKIWTFFLRGSVVKFPDCSHKMRIFYQIVLILGNIKIWCFIVM